MVCPCGNSLANKIPMKWQNIAVVSFVVRVQRRASLSLFSQSEKTSRCAQKLLNYDTLTNSTPPSILFPLLLLPLSPLLPSGFFSPSPGWILSHTCFSSVSVPLSSPLFNLFQYTFFSVQSFSVTLKKSCPEESLCTHYC